MGNKVISKFLQKYWWCVFLAIILMIALLNIATIALMGNVSFEEISPMKECSNLDWAGYSGDCSTTMFIPFNLASCLLFIAITIITAIAAGTGDNKKRKTSIILCSVLEIIFILTFTVVVVFLQPDLVSFDSPLSILFKNL